MTKETNGRDTFRFLEWPVYNDAQEVFNEIMDIVKALPNEIKYTLGGQVTRSALSIVLNIAEGSGRGTDKELNHFFNIALGSLNETVAALDALLRSGHMSQKKFGGLLERLASISRQLSGFKKTL